MNTNKIPLFFATDDNYVPYLLVTLESIVNNASKNNEYIFYVLNNGIKEENITKVNKYNHDNFRVEFVNVAEKMEKVGSTLHTRDYYSKSTYYRLFIPSMFPEYDKVLYLDCDIAVLSDIADLYNTDLGDNLVGGVPDEAVNLTPEFILYVEKFLGVEASKYFNAGILLMNTKELRKINFENVFINLIGSYTFNVAQDQDYLNVICKDRVCFVPQTWNKMPFPGSTIKEEDLNLIHYNLSFKPWHYKGIIYEDKFWNYAEKAGIKKDLEKIRDDFNEEMQAKDQAGGERLKQMAYNQAMQEETFLSLLNSGVIDKKTFVRK